MIYFHEHIQLILDGENSAFNLHGSIYGLHQFNNLYVGYYKHEQSNRYYRMFYDIKADIWRNLQELTREEFIVELEYNGKFNVIDLTSFHS